MKLPDGVEWGVHVAALLGMVPPGRSLPAARLAEFHGVPAAYLAKHLQALSRADILESVQGPGGGYRLSRPAAAITMLEVIEAIDGTESAFRCTEIRRRGPVARPAAEYLMPCSIHRAMTNADAAWRASLRTVTIADLVHTVLSESPPTALASGAVWIEEALR